MYSEYDDDGDLIVTMSEREAKSVEKTCAQDVIDTIINLKRFNDRRRDQLLDYMRYVQAIMCEIDVAIRVESDEL